MPPFRQTIRAWAAFGRNRGILKYATLSEPVCPPRVQSRMWALFTDGHRISRPFRTEEEAWHQARKSGLADGDVLEPGYEIKRFRESAEVLSQRAMA